LIGNHFEVGTTIFGLKLTILLLALKILVFILNDKISPKLFLDFYQNIPKKNLQNFQSLFLAYDGLLYRCSEAKILSNCKTISGDTKSNDDIFEADSKFDNLLDVSLKEPWALGI
jgi:hypothetical protein